MSAVRKPRESRGDRIVSFWLGKELREKLAETAEQRGVSRSELVRNAVETHLAKTGRK
jgi:metal-responsive CopG/Arc/MetJ family transcriptional regulator